MLVSYVYIWIWLMHGRWNILKLVFYYLHICSWYNRSIEAPFLQGILCFTDNSGCNALSVGTVLANMQLSKPFVGRCNAVSVDQHMELFSKYVETDGRSNVAPSARNVAYVWNCTYWYNGAASIVGYYETDEVPQSGWMQWKRETSVACAWNLSKIPGRPSCILVTVQTCWPLDTCAPNNVLNSRH